MGLGLRAYGPEALLDIVAVGLAYAIADLLRTGGRFEALAPTEPVVIFLASIFAGVLQVIFNVAFSVYWRNWNFASIEDVLAIAQSTVLVMVILLALDVATDARFMPIGAILAGGSFVLVIETAIKLRPRWPQILRAAIGRSRATEKLIVVGAGRMGQLLAADLANGNSAYRIACFVDDDRRKIGSYVRGVRVSGTVEDLPDLIAKHRPAFVVVAIAAASGAFIRRLVGLCEETETGVRRVTGFADFQANRTPLRNIGIEELLGREPVRFDTPEAKRYLADATLLVTGAAGSIGAELSRRLAELGPKELMLLDSNETGLYWLEKRIRPIREATFLLGDIRDRRWLESVFASRSPTIVFHAAAYKHVPLLESAPLQGIMTNVLGTANLLACCNTFGVERFVLISTDKAVEPTNVLGYTKRFAELLVIAEAKAHDARFAVVRFGNVLGSSGSAVPTFTEQIERGGPVTVTHPDATRFSMTLDEASSLVIEAGALAESGDVMVLDMGGPISILDLARRMIRLQGLRTPADIEIAFTGLRPGEKLHERLFFETERPVGTDHPRVMRVSNAEPPALASLKVTLREIEARIADQDEAGALRIVVETVEAHDRAAQSGSDLAATEF